MSEGKNKKELEELFDDPLLSDVVPDTLGLFDVPETLQKKDYKSSDYVAQRRPCENFEDYAQDFKRVHYELKTGRRSLKKLTRIQSLKEGSYYITSGVLLYLEHIGELTERKGMKKKDARTRCIYENGTESDIYLDTLRKSVASDGYMVTESTEKGAEFLEKKFSVVTDEDVHDGWIYVLRSLSDKLEIKNVDNLYKIGFSTVPVKQRIAGAASDPTYLMDNVEIVYSWKTFNLNTKKLEFLIHQFFSAVQFNFMVTDKQGKKHRPKEWYQVPLETIKAVINKIIDGSIIHYRYNPSFESLERIEPEKKKKNEYKDLNILSLIIKKVWFDEIMAGNKSIEYRELKQTTLGRYTWVEKETGIRYLKKFDAIRFNVGYNKKRETALVEVLDTTFDQDGQIVEYHLGKILEKG